MSMKDPFENSRIWANFTKNLIFHRKTLEKATLGKIVFFNFFSWMSGGNKIKIFVRGTSVGGEKLENVKFFKFCYFQLAGEMEILFFCSLIGYTPNSFIQLDFFIHMRFFEEILVMVGGGWYFFRLNPLKISDVMY